MRERFVQAADGHERVAFYHMPRVEQQRDQMFFVFIEPRLPLNYRTPVLRRALRCIHSRCALWLTDTKHFQHETVIHFALLKKPLLEAGDGFVYVLKRELDVRFGCKTDR